MVNKKRGQNKIDIETISQDAVMNFWSQKAEEVSRSIPYVLFALLIFFLILGAGQAMLTSHPEYYCSGIPNSSIGQSYHRPLFLPLLILWDNTPKTNNVCFNEMNKIVSVYVPAQGYVVRDTNQIPDPFSYEFSIRDYFWVGLMVILTIIIQLLIPSIIIYWIILFINSNIKLAVKTALEDKE